MWRIWGGSVLVTIFFDGRILEIGSLVTIDISLNLKLVRRTLRVSSKVVSPDFS